MESGLELALLFGADTLEQEAAGYLACLEKAGAGGLKLTEAQALELAQTHRQTLVQAGRVALGPEAVEKLLEIFEDSPYLEEENCLYILEELTTLFCRYKSDTWDQLSDEMLLACMKTAFDGCCRGSLELLESRALPRLARQVREKGPSAAENFLAEAAVWKD